MVKIYITFLFMQTSKAKYSTLGLPFDVPSQTFPGGDPPHVMVTCMRMLCICVCLRKASHCLRRVLRTAYRYERNNTPQIQDNQITEISFEFVPLFLSVSIVTIDDVTSILIHKRAFHIRICRLPATTAKNTKSMSSEYDVIFIFYRYLLQNS